MKIIIDQDKCIGCNLCEDVSGGTIGIKFGVNGKAGQNSNVDFSSKQVLEKAKLAVDTCPMRAITVEELLVIS